MPFNGPVIVGKPADEAHLISFWWSCDGYEERDDDSHKKTGSESVASTPKETL